MAISKAQAQQLIDEFRAEFVGLSGLKFVLLHDERDFHEHYGKNADAAIEAWATRKAAFSRTTNTVAVATHGAVDAEDFKRSLRHEGLGHYGINTYAQQEKRAILEVIVESRDSSASMRGAWAYIDAAYPGSSESEKAEEVFCTACEIVGSRHPFDAADARQAWHDAIETRTRPLERYDLHQIAESMANGIRQNTRQQQISPRTNADQFRLKSAPFKQYRAPTQGESIMATSSTTPSAGASAAQGAGAEGNTPATDPAKALRRRPIDKDRQVSEALDAGAGVTDPDDAVRNLTENQNRPLHRTKLPGYVHEQFYENGGRYFSVEGSRNGHYFIDQGHRVVLNSKQQVSRTAQLAIDIANAREWRSIQVTGSQTFRREAWMRASVAGLAVSGYAPSQQDLAELEHRQADAKTTPAAARAEADAVQDAPPQVPAQEPQGASQRPTSAVGASERQKSAQTAAAAAAVVTYSLAEQSGSKKPPRQLDGAKEAVKQFLSTDARKRPHLVETRIDADGKETSRVIGSTTDGPKPSHTLASDMSELRAQLQPVPTAGQSAAPKPALSARREHAAQDARSELVTSQNNLDAAVAFEEANPQVAAKSHPRLAGPYAVLGAYDAKLKEQGVNEDARKAALNTMRGTLVEHIREGRYDSIKTRQARFPARETAGRTQQQEPSQALSA